MAGGVRTASSVAVRVAKRDRVAVDAATWLASALVMLTTLDADAHAARRRSRPTTYIDSDAMNELPPTSVGAAPSRSHLRGAPVALDYGTRSTTAVVNFAIGRMSSTVVSSTPTGKTSRRSIGHRAKWNGARRRRESRRVRAPAERRAVGGDMPASNARGSLSIDVCCRARTRVRVLESLNAASRSQNRVTRVHWPRALFYHQVGTTSCYAFFGARCARSAWRQVSPWTFRC